MLLLEAGQKEGWVFQWIIVATVFPMFFKKDLIWNVLACHSQAFLFLQIDSKSKIKYCT